MTTLVKVKVGGREISPHKCVQSPNFDSRTVLTRSPWQFVELWLRRENKKEALFYWRQASEFGRAAVGLPTQSAPLLHYYSFMNATKALLSAKGIAFDPHHGVRAHNMRGASSKISIANEGIRILSKGIVPALSSYYGELETSNTHSLQDLLFNLPHIHRTYCLTYPNQTEMFVPITTPRFVYDPVSREVKVHAQISKNFQTTQVVKRIATVFTLDPSAPRGSYEITSVANRPFLRPQKPTAADILNLQSLQEEIRKSVLYINGSEALWYIKSTVAGANILRRMPTTITLAAMHRLSELCRYKPVEFNSFLGGQKNWLISEFIQQSPEQFIDEIASEMTGHQILAPNIRAAN
ncbi:MULTISPECIES: YaaC family protein [unclassified Pseudomonas]|uniref:YaaC family protein n=1 Tax=unclassified Pseudomonas TaxID=196821 RepID=UPI0009DE54B6|nr:MULTISPECIES: YaaC family protein [unclassified Pseudomonas]